MPPAVTVACAPSELNNGIRVRVRYASGILLNYREIYWTCIARGRLRHWQACATDLASAVVGFADVLQRLHHKRIKDQTLPNFSPRLGFGGCNY